jgi:hypothetical protein
MDTSPSPSPSRSPAASATLPPADPTDEAAVARLMAAIAGGDRPAIWSLRITADGPVRSRVRGELRRLGVRYEAEDLDGIVIDAVLAIADIAGSWQAGGAPPWAWAHHRVVGAVHRHVGTFADSIEALGDGDTSGALDWLATRVSTSIPAAATGAAAGSPAARGRGGDAVDPGDAIAAGRAALRRLAATRPLAALLDEALTEVASPRDAAVWLVMHEERAAGNRHPAVTVGARFALRADAVRQVAHRVRRRLDRLAGELHFAALRDLPALADGRSEPPTAG